MVSVRKNYPGIEVEADWEELQEPFLAVLRRELSFSDDWRVRNLLSGFPAVVESSIEINGKKQRVKFTLFGSNAKCFFDVSPNELDNPHIVVLEAFNRSLHQLLKKALEPYVEAAKIFPIILSDLSHFIEGKVRSVLRSDLKELASDIFKAIEPLIMQKVAELVKQNSHEEEVAVR